MKITKITLKDFEQELVKGAQVVKKRHARSTLEQDRFYIENSKAEIEKLKSNCGDVEYAYRENLWYIIFYKLNKEIGTFTSIKKAKEWVKKFLGES